MGEISKLVGDIGEDIVGNFFELIGWENTLSNQNLDCLKPRNHASSGSKKKSRQTHGIDYIHSYRSSLENNTINNVIISVKNTSKPYPNSPKKKFKGHITDLAQAIECFNRSPLKASQSNKFSDFKKLNDIGVLFWLSHSDETYNDLVAKVENSIIDSKLNFNCIYLVDNLRIEFIFQVMTFFKSKFSDHEVLFYYPSTSLNYADGESKHGSSLPVEYINSPIIPFLLKKGHGQVDTLCLAVSNSFDEDEVAQLIQVAREYTSDITCNYLLLFPDYVQGRHADAVTNAKHLFENSLKNDLVAMSFRPDYRSLSNG